MCELAELKLHVNSLLLDYWGWGWRGGAGCVHNFSGSQKNQQRNQKTPPKTHREKARITYLDFQTHSENQGNCLLKVFYKISPLGLKQS